MPSGYSPISKVFIFFLSIVSITEIVFSCWLVTKAFPPSLSNAIAYGDFPTLIVLIFL